MFTFAEPHTHIYQTQTSENRKKQLDIEKIQIILTGRHLFGESFSLYMQLFDYILKLHKCETGMTVSIHFVNAHFSDFCISCGQRR